jgi:hypothetical protein
VVQRAEENRCIPAVQRSALLTARKSNDMAAHYFRAATTFALALLFSQVRSPLREANKVQRWLTLKSPLTPRSFYQERNSYPVVEAFAIWLALGQGWIVTACEHCLSSSILSTCRPILSRIELKQAPQMEAQREDKQDARPRQVAQSIR